LQQLTFKNDGDVICFSSAEWLKSSSSQIQDDRRRSKLEVVNSQ